jgi:carbohydrate diacid regulator
VGGMLLSRKLYQNIVNQVKDILGCEFGIMDSYGNIIACSNENNIGQSSPIIQEILECKDSMAIFGGIAFQKIVVKNKVELITFIHSAQEEHLKHLYLFTVNVSSIKAFYDEKYDKNDFLKRIILGKIEPGEIPIKARDMSIAANVSRAVFLIRTESSKEVYAYEIIQNLFPNKVKDFTIIVDEENTVLIRELKSKDEDDIEKNAKIIIDTLNTESMIKAVIGIGTAVDNLADIHRSFGEAQTALFIGGIFDKDKCIVNYNSLGLGRLIYQLPESTCQMFLDEIFHNGALESLDEEYLFTVQKFFDNNLNISETSRQMYVHRNTLVYRLEKIRKLTGLDLTKFDNAIIFKVAMLVKKYLYNGKN